MSEFQFYEFKAIDRPLTSAEKMEISSWSSRTSASNTGAIFTYSYGNFRQDEIEVVHKYFDAMFYLSNWGTTRLIFKFPCNLINAKELRQYCIEGLEISEKGDYTIIDLCIHDEESGRWIDGEGWLSSLVTIREDIIAGDYRCLYLIWLKVSTESVLYDGDALDRESKEPEVPANLGAMHEGLRDFVHLFEIDKDAIATVTERSTDARVQTRDYSTLVNDLPDKEKNDFLKRLYHNEPLLNAKLIKRLKTMIASEDNLARPKRLTVAEITQRIQIIKEKRKREEKQRLKEKRLAKLRKTEIEEPMLWQKVDLLIIEKKTKSYDDAIEILNDLKSLAIYKKQYEEFCNKVEGIIKQNSRLTGLKRRIENAKLTEAQKT